VCCSGLQCVALRCRACGFSHKTLCLTILQCVVVCSSAVQCDVVWCIVVQCVAESAMSIQHLVFE